MSVNPAGMRPPDQIERVSEEPVVFDWAWKEGEQVISHRHAGQPLAEGRSFECHAVGWDVMAESGKDIDDLIWLGKLQWEFQQATIFIAHLTALYGATVAAGQKAKSVYEQLADIDPNEYLYEPFQPGEMRLYRGLVQFIKLPVLLPAGVSWAVSLYMSQPFTTRGEIRWRLSLYGATKRTIVVG